MALNAAVYHAPACGTNGYFRDYFKVLRFWLIPFCVSSISVACDASPDECVLLFPTDPVHLFIHLFGMAAIITIGLLINRCVAPKCKGEMDKEERESNTNYDKGETKDSNDDRIQYDVIPVSHDHGPLISV